MVGSGLQSGAYTIQDVIQEMENTKVYMDSKIRLTTKDHIVVAFYTFLIYMSGVVPPLPCSFSGACVM